MTTPTLVERIKSLWTLNSPEQRERKASILADVRELRLALSEVMCDIDTCGISTEGADNRARAILAKTGVET